MSNIIFYCAVCKYNSDKKSGAIRHVKSKSHQSKVIKQNGKLFTDKDLIEMWKRMEFDSFITDLVSHGIAVPSDMRKDLEEIVFNS